MQLPRIKQYTTTGQQAIVALATVYLLSGFCSLVYQVVWIHRFTRVFGSTVQATAAVVAVFFTGLSLGSYLFGRISRRSDHPLRLYAILELIIAVYALLFPLLIGGAESIYTRLLTGEAPGEPVVQAARLCLAAVVLLPPTLLMGGTLPLLVSHLVTDVRSSGRHAGLLYGVNAAGAAAGSLAGGFLLIRMLGAQRTNLLAALLNLALGAVALWLARRHTPAAPTAEAPQQTPDPLTEDKGRRTVLLAFVVSGFTAMAYEVIWLRHLAFVFQDTIELYTGVVSFFIAGLALGSLAGRHWLPRLHRPGTTYGWLLTAGTILNLGVVLAVGLLYQPLARVAAGNALAVMTGLAVLILPPTLLMGAAFPLVGRLVTGSAREAGARIGTALALNTGAGIAGTLAAGFLLFPLLGLQGTLYLLMGLGMASAALVLGGNIEGPGRRWALVPLLLGLLYPSWMALNPGQKLPQALMLQNLPEGARLLEVSEGPGGTSWAVRQAGGTLDLMDNNVVIARGGSSALVKGFVPLLLAEVIPGRVLGLAFGGGLSTYAPRLQSQVQRLDLVDISPQNIRLALDLFPENQGLREDPRAHLMVADAYAYLKYNVDSYDLIFAEPTPPMYSFRNAALYTREFYGLAAEHLSLNGLFAQILPTGNLSPPETRGVMRTFAAAFPTCILWWNNTDLIMLGSRQALVLNAPTIQARLARPEMVSALRRASPTVDLTLVGEFLAGFLLDDESFRAAAGEGVVYTDDRSDLQYATGRRVSAENLDRIFQHLSPWSRMRDRVEGFAATGLDERILEQRRLRLKLFAYRRYPQRYTDLSLAYIMEHSDAPRQDLTILRKYAQQRGLVQRLAEIDRLLAGQAP
jgi:spermidine synthase